MSFDDQGDPARAAGTAREAAERDRIHYVIGHATLATSLAAGRVYDELRVFQVEPRASLSIPDRKSDSKFSLCGSEDQRAYVLASYLAGQLKVSTIDTLSESSEQIRTTRFIEELRKRNITTSSSDTLSAARGLNSLGNDSSAGAILVELAESYMFGNHLAELNQSSSKIPIMIFPRKNGQG